MFHGELLVELEDVLVEHYRPASETLSEWLFAGGSMVAQDWMLAGILHDVLLRCEPF